jgi:site-specific DNA recombinase
VVAAEQRGAKVKKRLAVYPVEAETVRLMFRLFREGDGTSGPMGVKTLTAWLDERGHRTRVGARWGIGQLHKILTSPTCEGEYRFNRKVWKTKEAKPQADQVAIAVDPIIDVDTFGAVQAMLRAATRGSPRRVSSPGRSCSPDLRPAPAAAAA